MQQRTPFPGLFSLLLSTLAVVAGDAWPGFRGPNASGVSETARPPAKFGPGENQLWKSDVPGSPSSPCVWGDRIFLTTFANGKPEVRCLDRRDGRTLWSRPVPATRLEEFHPTEGSPAASTPVTDGERVVSYFGSFGLICHDFKGRELWRHTLPVAMTAGNFGSGTSPILAGELVILNRDLARGSSLLAVRLQDGTKVWETPRADAPTSYSTPVLHGDELLVAGSLTLRGYDAKTGVQRWIVRGLSSYTCTTPVLGEGLIYYAGWAPGKADSPWPSWESTVSKDDKNHDGVISIDEFSMGPAWFKAQDIDGNGKITREDWDAIGNQMKRGENVLLAIKPGGRGDVTDTHVAWKFARGLPYVPSPLCYQGRLYLVKDGGMMSSFDAKTGQPFYTQERLKAQGSYYASPVAADGRIIVASLDGKVSVVKAGGDAPEVLHAVDFKERIAATPALVGNQIFIRTASALYAFGN